MSEKKPQIGWAIFWGIVASFFLSSPLLLVVAVGSGSIPAAIAGIVGTLIFAGCVYKCRQASRSNSSKIGGESQQVNAEQPLMQNAVQPQISQQPQVQQQKITELPQQQNDSKQQLNSDSRNIQSTEESKQNISHVESLENARKKNQNASAIMSP